MVLEGWKIPAKDDPADAGGNPVADANSFDVLRRNDSRKPFIAGLFIQSCAESFLRRVGLSRLYERRPDSVENGFGSICAYGTAY